VYVKFILNLAKLIAVTITAHFPRISEYIVYLLMCTEDLPEYVIVAIILGFLLVVVLIFSLLAYRSAKYTHLFIVTDM